MWKALLLAVLLLLVVWVTWKKRKPATSMDLPTPVAAAESAQLPLPPLQPAQDETPSPFGVPVSPPYEPIERPADYKDFPSSEEMRRIQNEQYQELLEQRRRSNAKQ